MSQPNRFSPGYYPLGYVGVNPTTPPNTRSFQNQDPTTTDYYNFMIGDFWINKITTTSPVSYRVWILVALASHQATWILFAAGTGAVFGLQPDVGAVVQPILGVIDVFSQPTCGSTVFTSNGGTNHFNLNVTDANNNTLIGLNGGNLTITGTHNTGLGSSVLSSLTSGVANVAIGVTSLNACTSGTANIGIADGALVSLTTGNNNIGIGEVTFQFFSNGSNNIGLGGYTYTTGSGGNGLLTGSNNIAIGSNCANSGIGAGSAYRGSESNNILVGHQGIVSDASTIRIGSYGTGGGTGLQNKCYIAACYSNYGTANTFVGELAGNTSLTIASATNNVSVGYNTLASLTTGVSNTAVGYSSQNAVNTGVGNSSLGNNALLSCTSGVDNVAAGIGALKFLVSGNYNIGLGVTAGSNYTTSETSNILLSNAGVASESNTIRIGTQGTGNAQQNAAYMAGIYNTAVGATNAIVIVDNTGKLGTSGTNSFSTGTFTPTLTFSTSTGTITYTTQAGKYTVIGNMVNFIATIFGTSVGTSSGNASLAGLPFTVASVANLAQDQSLSLNNIPFTMGYTYSWANAIGGTTTALLALGGSNVVPTGVTAALIGASSGTWGLTVYGFYFTS